jgi:hypothetical protein
VCVGVQQTDPENDYYVRVERDPYFISPLVTKLLRKRNKLCRNGKLEEAAAFNVKINELVAENKQKLWRKQALATLKLS